MATPSVRASDADREATAQRLQRECAAGRLTPDELSERLDRAYAARDTHELAELTQDLPAESGSGAPARRRPRGEQIAAVALQSATPFVVCVIVWALSGAGYFWPAWVAIPLVIRLLAVLGGHDDHPHPHRDRRERHGRRGLEPPPPPPPPPGL